MPPDNLVRAHGDRDIAERCGADALAVHADVGPWGRVDVERAVRRCNRHAGRLPRVSIVTVRDNFISRASLTRSSRCRPGPSTSGAPFDRPRRCPSSEAQFERRIEGHHARRAGRRLDRERDEHVDGGSRGDVDRAIHRARSVGHDHAVFARRQVALFERRATGHCSIDSYACAGRNGGHVKLPWVSGAGMSTFSDTTVPFSTVTARRRSPASFRRRTSCAPGVSASSIGVTPRATPSTMTAAPSGREFSLARSVGVGAAVLAGTLARCRAYTMAPAATPRRTTAAAMPMSAFFDTARRAGASLAAAAAVSSSPLKFARGSLSVSARMGRRSAVSGRSSSPQSRAVAAAVLLCSYFVWWLPLTLMQFGANVSVKNLCETTNRSLAARRLLSKVLEHFKTCEKTKGACRTIVRHAP